MGSALFQEKASKGPDRKLVGEMEVGKHNCRTASTQRMEPQIRPLMVFAQLDSFFVASYNFPSLSRDLE